MRTRRGGSPSSSARASMPKLRLVHVAMSMPAAAPRKLRQDYERHFAVSQRLLEERAPAATARGINVKTLVTTGDPVEVVAATAHDESIDLVVIGTHGHERAGEVPLRQCRRAPAPACPVYRHRRETVSLVCQRRGDRRYARCRLSSLLGRRRPSGAQSRPSFSRAASDILQLSQGGGRSRFCVFADPQADAAA